MEPGRISVSQFLLLVLLFTIGSSILILPGGITLEAKQDAWISTLLGLAAGLLLVQLYITLSKCYEGQSFTTFCQQVAGRWGGGAISLLMISFSFTLGAAVLRNLGDFVTTQILPETPIQFIHLSFILVAVMAVRLGLEVFARAADIFVPWISLLILMVIVLILPQIEFTKMEPIYENGMKPIIRGAIPLIGSPYLELVIFLIIIPYIHGTKHVGKAFLTATLIGGFLLFLVTFLCILVLSSDITMRQMYPTYVLAKKISIGKILERTEVLLAGSWFLTIFFKLTLTLYASTLGLAQLLKLTDYRPLILPLGMIMVVYSIIAYENTIAFIFFVSQIWPYFAATVGLGLPLLLLAAAKLRRR